MRDTSEQSLDPAPRRSRTGLKLAGVTALVIAVAVAGFGIWQRGQHERKLASWTDAQAVPTVAIVRPQPETKVQALTLPGNVDAWFEAPIYARVPGYLQMWYKDIGARVKAGELLGVIDTPDLDEQLHQAKANLNSAQANLTLAEVTAKRWKALLSSSSVSQQSVDEKVADAVALKAKVAAAQANVDRLNALEGFKRLIAPFDGVVTARKDRYRRPDQCRRKCRPRTVRGRRHPRDACLCAGAAGLLRPDRTCGMTATLRLPQYPDRTFTATVLTTSNAINRESRTVLVELVAENPRRQTVARHVRRCQLRPSGRYQGRADPGQRVAVPVGRLAGRGARSGRQGGDSLGSRRPQFRHHGRGALRGRRERPR